MEFILGFAAGFGVAWFWDVISAKVKGWMKKDPEPPLP